jgi:hypothetical protein
MRFSPCGSVRAFKPRLEAAPCSLSTTKPDLAKSEKFSVTNLGIHLYAQPIHAQGARPYHVQKPDIQGAVMVL